MNIENRSILDAFTYGDYPENHDGHPRIGDYVYVFRQLSPAMEEEGFDARIVLYSDESRGIKPIPAIIYHEQTDDPESGEYVSILDFLLDGYDFTQITKEQYESDLKENQ